MKSPFTGGDAVLCHEKQSFEFRKDNFEIVRIVIKVFHLVEPEGAVAVELADWLAYLYLVRLLVITEFGFFEEELFTGQCFNRILVVR